MDANPVGADDYAILVHARLIDPEVWPEDEDPEVTPITAPRLRNSLEAAYRILVHRDEIVDPTDIVARLSVALGLDEAVEVKVGLPDGLAPEHAARLVSLLMDDTDAAETGIDPVEPVVMHASQDAVGTPDDEPPATEADPCDPDHDPEAGISHVGDADVGAYHEEQQ